MRVAIYARVSTRHQERDKTIDSQLAALRAWVDQHAHDLRPEHVFTDPGHSGGRLDRPGLDRLRDAAAGGDLDAVAVYSPDRLARRYTHQALLLEEFRKAGCPVAFVHRPISDDPHDQLLLQIQGAVAEYERSVIGERFRRGKLQRARAGHWVAGRASYGYRYVPKRDGVPGHLVIDHTQAEAVRTMFRWLIDERLSLRAIAQRLADSPWRPKNGKRMWSVVVIHRILSDPLYAGTGYANRFVLTPSPDPRRRARRPDAQTCRRERPREEWIPIPVPAIIDTATHERAVAQLARNGAMCRRNSGRFYLLRCLLSCGACGRAMIGVSHPGRHRRGEPRRYYKCCGRDLVCPKYQTRCTRRLLHADPLEAAVWDHVHRMIADPDTLRSQFGTLAQAPDGPTDGRAEAEKWAAQLRRLDREEVRLVDAYQAEAISLDELKERREQLQIRRQSTIAQRDAAATARASRASSDAAWREWTTFSDRIRDRLESLSPNERQLVLQLVVERVIVKDGAVEVRHVIPLAQLPAAAGATASSVGSDAQGASAGRPVVRLCSDRVRGPGDLSDEDRRRGVVETLADRLADADAHSGATRAHLLGIAEVDLFAPPREVRRVRFAPVPFPLGHRHVGFGNHRRRRNNGFVQKVVEESRAFDPFARAAEVHLHEFGDVVLLLLDGAAELGNQREEFLDPGVEVRVVGGQLGRPLAGREVFGFG